MPTKKQTKKPATKTAPKAKPAAKPTKAASASAKQASKTKTAKGAPASSAAPSLFRINIEVGDVEQAAKDWGALLGLEGRPQAGSRVYFTAGAVTLQVVEHDSPHPATDLYFLVDDLESVHERAKKLGWLSTESVHGQPGGVISVRPWGERSFYVEDTWGNPLCFVQTGTTYPG